MHRIPHAAELVNRRASPRVELAGRYSLSLDPRDGRAPLSCELMDHSVTGVRLRLPEDIVLPEQVAVVIGGLSHNARIAWRDGMIVGVDFVDEHHSIF